MSHLQACPSGFPESRYIVIKETDLYEAGRAGLISVAALATLVKIQTAVSDIRKAYHKPALETLTIEKNWPEYQPLLEAIAARVLAELNSVDSI